MSLQKQIREDMVAAMKAKESEKLSLLRVLTGELATNEKRKEKEKKTEQEIILKMSNNAKEMGNDSEVEILDKYIIKVEMLGETQLRTIIGGIIQMNEYSDPRKDMGKVMGTLKTHPMSAQIDNKTASVIVRELLTQ